MKHLITSSRISLVWLLVIWPPRTAKEVGAVTITCDTCRSELGLCSMDELGFGPNLEGTYRTAVTEAFPAPQLHVHKGVEILMTSLT